MRVIKRYSNRKLYDTIARTYITLENIEVMIKQGEELQIVDNETNEDITAGALSQIIAERTRKSHAYSPSIFIELIKKGSGTMCDYGRKMLQNLGDTVYTLEEEVEKRVKKLVSSGELTEEEGKELTKEVERQRGHYIQKIEQQLGNLSDMVLSKLSIPNKRDIDKLQNCVKKLEDTVQKLEQQIATISFQTQSKDQSK